MLHRLHPLVAITLPGSRTRGVSSLALFGAVQIADAVLTSAGMARFGPAIEANPILLFYVCTFGVAGTLIVAKLVAIAGAALLHAYSYHLVLAILTVTYVFGAIVPWAWAFGL